jgi:hypothetical protein
MSLNPLAAVSSSPTRVGAAESILFSVAANLLKHGSIAVRFGYAWEGTHAAKVQHQLLFDAADELRLKLDVMRWLETVTDPGSTSSPRR